MAVPYNPLPNVAPQQLGAAPQLRVRANAQDFGANIGQANMGLAQELSNTTKIAVDYINEKQIERNDTELTNAQTAMNEAYGKVSDWYESLEGVAAVDAQEEALKKYKEARQQVRSTLSNDAVRRAYDKSTLQEEGFAIRNTVRYANSQGKVAAKNASSAAIAQAIKQSGKPGLSDEEFWAAQGKIDFEIEKQMKQSGYGSYMYRDPDTYEIKFTDDDSGKKAKAVFDEIKSDAGGKAWEERIGGLKNTDIVAAHDMLEENKDIMPPDAYAKLSNSLNTPYRDHQSRVLSDQAFAKAHTDYKAYISDKKNKYMSETDWLIANKQRILDNAKADAEKRYPGDVRFNDQIAGRLKADIGEQVTIAQQAQYNIDRQIARQQHYEAESMKADKGAVYKFITQGGFNGQPLLSEEAFEAAPPNVKAAWDRMKERDPFAYETYRNKIMRQNATNDGGYLGTSTWEVYSKVLDGSITDPMEIAQFIQPGQKKNSPITSSGLKEATKILQTFQKQGDGFRTAMKGFIDKARNDILGVKYGDVRKNNQEDPKFTAWMQQALPKIFSGLNKGLTADQMFDPDSKDYIGGNISNFQIPLDAQINYQLKGAQDSLVQDNAIGTDFNKDILPQLKTDDEKRSAIKDAYTNGLIDYDQAAKLLHDNKLSTPSYKVPAGGF